MIGTTVSHYRVLKELGRGGMGVVYRAEDTVLGRPVALKFISPAISTKQGSVERFLREARAAAALNHPNICTIYQIGEHDGRWYLAMEALDGQTLERLLASGVLPIERVVDLGIQIADGLSAAHAKGIVHRDIKPSNIFVTDEGRIKILDFGLAKLRPAFGRLASADTEDKETIADGIQLTGATIVGTASYMSPEQARGEPVDSRTDVFSLGIVLYELATGRQPFTGKTAPIVFNAILSRAPAAPSMFRPDLPQELEAIIWRALEKDPAHRYSLASELASDLGELKQRLQSARALQAPSFEREIATTSRVAPLAPHPSPWKVQWIRAYLERFAIIGSQHLQPHQYIWPAAGVQDSTTGDEISTDHVGHLLKELLLQDPNAFVLLLGDYGSGKTSFLRMFGRELAAEALASGAGVPVPIYLNLGFARSRDDLLEAIAAYVSRYGVSVSSSAWMDFLLNHPAVLLLDGFDEMAGWADYRMIPDILQKIRGLQLAPGVRIVLSGRSSFFRSDIEVGIVGARYLVRLRPFELDDMLTYVTLRDPQLTSRAATLLDENAGLRDLCRNPIHLSLFVNWLRIGDSPLRRSASTSGESGLQLPPNVEATDVSVVDLYHRFFMKTLQDNFGTMTSWTLDQRWQFVRRVAWDWFQERVFEWPAKEFSKRVAEELPDLARAEIDAYTLQLLNCTFFTRVGDRYRFLHQSYVEYLVSESLRDSLLSGDLSKWDMPLYTDIFEFTYQLLKAKGFEHVPVDWIMETGSVRAQANFLAMSWRHTPPAMEPHLRKQLRYNPHDLVRFLAAMGIGLYAPTPENVDCIGQVFQHEANSVVRAMARSVASHWLAGGIIPALAPVLHSVAHGEVTLLREDGERATLQHVGSNVDAERALFAFRRAMIQGDHLWTAAVGGMLGLAVVQDRPSYSYIFKMASSAKHPEIRNAYRMVQKLTGLPDLPILGTPGSTGPA